MKTNVIFDLGNLAWITRFSEKLNSKKREAHAKELIAAKCISTIVGISNSYDATGVLLAVDSSHVWRKDVYADYKNRDSSDIYYEDVIEAVTLISEFFEQNSSVKVCKVDKCEADDIIAVAVQENSTDAKNVIISSDKDFIQLLDYPNTVLYSPAQKIERTVEDAKFYLFEKCIRGDSSDNIFSAYPRIRVNRLKEAFVDPVAMVNLMETVLNDEEGTKVSESYEFNRLLIDLTKQPIELRDNIKQSLSASVTGKYNQVKMLSYIARHKLVALNDDVLKPAYSNIMKSVFTF